MKMQSGDIVRIYAPSAGKQKYHLCVCALGDDATACFLFINSKDGYQGDFVLQGDVLECLPASATGKSVISCSVVLRYTEKQLALFSAEVIGILPAAVAAALAESIRQGKTLSDRDKHIVLSGLSAMLERGRVS